MIKKYKIGKFDLDIKTMEFERETGSMLFSKNGRRVVKICELESYYDTPELAKEALIKREQIKLDYAKEEVARHEKSLELVKSIDLKQSGRR
jgi:hypothetical protein